MKHMYPWRQQNVFIDFPEIRSSFSAFCHDLDTHEEKSSGAGEKI